MFLFLAAGFLALIPILFVLYARDLYIKQQEKERAERIKAERQAFLDEWGSDDNYYDQVVKPRIVAERRARAIAEDRKITDENERWKMRHWNYPTWSRPALEWWYDGKEMKPEDFTV